MAEHLIINSAYEEPSRWWRYDEVSGEHHIIEGRRPAGYYITKEFGSRDRKFHALDLVNAIRPLVKRWREDNYPGVTAVTRKLLEHWRDDNIRDKQFFYCQLEAIETLIWRSEASADYRGGIRINNDGGEFGRLCTKMCTGSGKTIVMAMLIAWQVCNKASYPRDVRFSKNVLVVTPNLTVRRRLEVLQPGGVSNYYEQFSVVPVGLKERLQNGRVVIVNWQAMAYEDAEALSKKKSVDKRGPKSDRAYAREVLGDIAKSKNLLVINDEAHHAWRKYREVRKGDSAEYKESSAQATVWVGGLDRIHRAVRILNCYDFSATPFMPSGNVNEDERLFDWIVSDFSLDDGIEAGLVKTPRYVVRDDGVPARVGDEYRSKFRHIYREVKTDLNRKAEASETLPDLVMNAYHYLALDWQRTFESWCGKETPPVMITVANRTETAARVSHAFRRGDIPVGGLCAEDKILHIDSRTLDSDKTLRDKADTVGKVGGLGEQIRNVISVGMLSEGWDAKTVTQIMGLRAFTSQLLCEQVIGRGLRRTSYDVGADGRFSPEYVNVFGIPFEILPCEEGESGSDNADTKQVASLPERKEYEIMFPNVIRIDRVFKQELTFDLSKIPTLTLEADSTSVRADLAPAVDGEAVLSSCTEFDLERLAARVRLQQIIFETAGSVYDIMRAAWQAVGTKHALLGQVIKLAEEYLRSGDIVIKPKLFETSPMRRMIVYSLNMRRIIQHIWDYIKSEETEHLVPVCDKYRRVCSTDDMATWYTARETAFTKKSQINRVVCDSAWEYTESYVLDKNRQVKAWAKNDHLGFYVYYTYNGAIRKYYPDFLVRLDNGVTLVLETKGYDSAEARAKYNALKEWVEAVNNAEEFGRWACDISRSPKDVDGIIARHL